MSDVRLCYVSFLIAPMPKRTAVDQQASAISDAAMNNVGEDLHHPRLVYGHTQIQASLVDERRRKSERDRLD